MNISDPKTELEQQSEEDKLSTLSFRRAEDRAVVISAGLEEVRSNGIVAVIPAYNEERFIGSVVLKVRQHAGRVIVVDDGSNDCTAEVAASAGAMVVKHIKNRGKGAALNTGFHLARRHSPRVVVVLDADGQHLPEELAAVVKPVLEGRADIVVGSRYIQRTSQVPQHRIWGHRAFNLLTELASGVHTTDSQSGYRAFSPAAVEKIEFQSMGFSVESEMQFITQDLGLRMLEVPITIRYLDQPKRSVWAQGMSVLNGILHLVGQYRPLLFLGLPGFIMLMAALLLGVVVVERYQQMHVLATGYAIICALLGISGMVMLTTGVTLHSIRGLLIDMLGNRK